MHCVELGRRSGGTPVERWVDLGHAMLRLSGGASAARVTLLESLCESDWNEATTGFGDPDLANR